MEMMTAELAALVAHRRLLPRAGKAGGATNGETTNTINLGMPLGKALARPFLFLVLVPSVNLRLTRYSAGPSLVSLLALSSELQTFLVQSFPPLMPLLAFRANVVSAADLSALLATDPARTANGPSGPRQSNSDARGSMPWELVCRGVLASDSGSYSGADVRRGSAGGVPLASALTVLSLFGDAVEAAQAQEVSMQAGKA